MASVSRIVSRGPDHHSQDAETRSITSIFSETRFELNGRLGRYDSETWRRYRLPSDISLSLGRRNGLYPFPVSRQTHDGPKSTATDIGALDGIPSRAILSFYMSRPSGDDLFSMASRWAKILAPDVKLTRANLNLVFRSRPKQ